MVSDQTAPWSDLCNRHWVSSVQLYIELSSCPDKQVGQQGGHALPKDVGRREKRYIPNETQDDGDPERFKKENYGKDATLEGPCLETSATAGWVALNDSRGFERAGSKEESDCYEGGLSSISSWTKGFPAVTCSDLQPMPAGVGRHHHPLPWGSEETVEFDELLQTTAWF